MGYDKNQRPILTQGTRLQPVQELTGASTGTRVKNYGITTITVTTGEGTAANLVYTIDAPVPGAEKLIAADLNSTKTVTIRTPSSADTFFGSTKNSFAWSTGSTHPPSSIELLGLTTAQWMIVNINTPGAPITSTGGAAMGITIAGATAA
ncbi:MAG: hypothetical protein R3324_03540 [Halobacteriales archaeon]|nr:hypothetical protein [Halobacteriales archaeon]